MSRSTEPFDPGRWPMGFFHPASGKACRWLNIGVIRLTSFPPCWFPWSLISFVWIKKTLITKYPLLFHYFSLLQINHHHNHVMLSAWTSLTHSRHPSLSTGPQSYIQYRHRAVVCMFVQVILPSHVHVKMSIGVHHLWARPYISSSVLHVWFV